MFAEAWPYRRQRSTTERRNTAIWGPARFAVLPARRRERPLEAGGSGSDAGQEYFAGRYSKKGLAPTRRRGILQWIIDMYQVSVERACRLGQFPSGSWYRKSIAQDQSALRMRIRDIAMSRPRFGYERIHILLRREGWHVNLKRVHRLYCLETLQVRMRVRRHKRLSLHRAAPKATCVDQRWSMDFVHDQLADGCVFRVLTVLDNWSRERPLLEVGFRLTGDSVVHALSRAARQVRLPASITVDHGTEFTSKALDIWAWENKVLLDFTRPGKPTDNGLCESFNGRLRDECRTPMSSSLDHAKPVIEAWRRD